MPRWVRRTLVVLGCAALTAWLITGFSYALHGEWRGGAVSIGSVLWLGALVQWLQRFQRGLGPYDGPQLSRDRERAVRRLLNRGLLPEDPNERAVAERWRRARAAEAEHLLAAQSKFVAALVVALLAAALLMLAFRPERLVRREAGLGGLVVLVLLITTLARLTDRSRPSGRGQESGGQCDESGTPAT